MKNSTTVEQVSERELVITRLVNGPPSIVYEAWTKPELLKQWWTPKSMGMVLVSCEADVRVGGRYCFVIKMGDNPPMEFIGKYLEVTPGSRLVWTNDERGESNQVTTTTFEEKDGKTLVVIRETYKSKEAFEESQAMGAASVMEETIGQLEALLATMR